MKKRIYLTLSVLAVLVSAEAQEMQNSEIYETQHYDGKGLRIVALIGHTFINSQGMDGNLYIPSWGLDIDYWFNHQWGIGMHNDIEIETFVVERNQAEAIERDNPTVFTFDALYHIGSGFVISIGPGVELEQSESFFLARVGLEYEYNIGHAFYLMPTIFHDRRFDGFSTTSVGLGIGHYF